MLPIIKALNDIQIKLNASKIADEGANYMKSITPIDKGNARRNTFSRGDTIYAQYPYAKRLDEGWSKQNTTGLIDPTIRHLDDLIKRGLL